MWSQARRHAEACHLMHKTNSILIAGIFSAVCLPLPAAPTVDEEDVTPIGRFLINASRNPVPGAIRQLDARLPTSSRPM